MLTADESVEPFNAQRKLPKREAPLGRQAAVTQAIEVLWQRVLGPSMIRRYSRPRHFTAGWTSPREFCARAGFLWSRNPRSVAGRCVVVMVSTRKIDSECRVMIQDAAIRGRSRA